MSKKNDWPKKILQNEQGIREIVFKSLFNTALENFINNKNDGFNIYK